MNELQTKEERRMPNGEQDLSSGKILFRGAVVKRQGRGGTVIMRPSWNKNFPVESSCSGKGDPRETADPSSVARRRILRRKMRKG